MRISLATCPTACSFCQSAITDNSLDSFHFSLMLTHSGSCIWFFLWPLGPVYLAFPKDLESLCIVGTLYCLREELLLGQDFSPGHEYDLPFISQDFAESRTWTAEKWDNLHTVHTPSLLIYFYFLIFLKCFYLYLF